MRIFDRFRGQSDKADNEPAPPSPAQADFDAAQALAEQNDWRGVLARLTRAFSNDAGFAPPYALAARALRQLGSHEEAALFEAVVQNFGKHTPFFDLGYHFIDVGNPRLAVPFLQRAHRLNPQDIQTACELAIAYTHQLQPGKGREALAHLYQKANFWQQYQYFWCCLLDSFETDKIHAFVRASRAALSPASDESENENAALIKLGDCLARFEALNPSQQGVPPVFVRDWHFIQYGAALLSFFDDEDGDDALQVAGGRFVALWGQMASVAAVLQKLMRFLTALDRMPDRLLYLPDRDSEIIGLALGSLLNLMPEEADETNVDGPNRLIVAADDRALENFRVLYRAFPRQTVFALNVHWTDDGSVTPDVGGLMTQAFYFPWRGGNMALDPDTKKMIKSQEDKRTSFVIAAELFDEASALSGEADAHFADYLAFYQKHADLLMGAPSTAPDGMARRLRFNRDSPVPGASFG